jgi:hypothetical protein
MTRKRWNEALLCLCAKLGVMCWSRCIVYSFLAWVLHIDVTRYGLDGPENESTRGRTFTHPSSPALGFTQPPVQWVLGPLGVKRPERGLNLTPHLTPRLKEVLSYNYSLFVSPWPVLGSTLPLLHGEECSSSHINHFIPTDEAPTAHIKWETGWTAEPESWKREISYS